MTKTLLSLVLAILSLLYANTGFDEARQAVSLRWESFHQDRVFTPFQANRTDAELIAEFKQIDQDRLAIFKTPDFKVSQELVANDLVRAPGCAAFAFNNTTESYNASTVFLDGKA